MSIAGGQAGLVELRSDINATPTTVRAEGRAGSTGAVLIGVAINDDYTVVLCYMVPAGHYVRIVTTNITGTPTFTLSRQTEEDL
jgi:hypothetical protein